MGQLIGPVSRTMMGSCGRRRGSAMPRSAAPARSPGWSYSVTPRSQTLVQDLAIQLTPGSLCEAAPRVGFRNLCCRALNPTLNPTLNHARRRRGRRSDGAPGAVRRPVGLPADLQTAGVLRAPGGPGRVRARRRAAGRAGVRAEGALDVAGRRAKTRAAQSFCALLCWHSHDAFGVFRTSLP